MNDRSCPACQHFNGCPEPGTPCHLFSPIVLNKTYSNGEQVFGGVAAQLARYGIETPKGL